MRDYINGNISINGRNIPYEIVTACDYLIEKYGLADEEVEKYVEENEKAYELIGQIIALKHAHYIMRRVSHSCGSIAEGLYNLKERLIIELNEKYKVRFDEEFVGNHY